MNEEHSTPIRREPASNIEQLGMPACASFSSFVRRPRTADFENEDEGRGRSRIAFTLIELLVVVAIMAILAGMVLAVAGSAKRKALVKRVQGELAQLETAIDRYKIDNGFHPPDNADLKTFAGDPYANVKTPAATNSLYYELSGVVFDGTFYITTYGTNILKADLENAFNVGGVLNASKGGGRSAAKNYIKDFKPKQHSDFNTNLRVISTDAEGPISVSDGSPFCYVSSRPVKNPQTMDLWVDILVGSKTNRISNWSEDPEVVSY